MLEVGSDQIQDVVLSQLVPLETADGVILYRRTTLENSKALIPYGTEAFGHLRAVERNLEKGMKLFLADSLTPDFKAYFPTIQKSIDYLSTRFSKMDVSFYRNEILFFEGYLRARYNE